MSMEIFRKVEDDERNAPEGVVHIDAATFLPIVKHGDWWYKYDGVLEWDADDADSPEAAYDRAMTIL